MGEVVVGIHSVHRKLAEFVEVATDKHGNFFFGAAEMRYIVPMLKQNYELVRKLDELKHLSFHAFEMGDMEWQMDICRQIEVLEQQFEL